MKAFYLEHNEVDTDDDGYPMSKVYSCSLVKDYICDLKYTKTAKPKTSSRWFQNVSETQYSFEKLPRRLHLRLAK